MDVYSDFEETTERERTLERILVSRLDPVTKVRRIVAMGVDEQDADEIVQKYELGQMAPVYYERLDFSDEEDQALQDELKREDD